MSAGAGARRDFDRTLDDYAALAVRVGVNLQPGQRLLIHGATSAAPLIRRVAEHAYRTGARLVDVLWDDDEVRLARFLHAPEGSFEEYPRWRSEAPLEMARHSEAVLYVHAPHPGLLDAADPERITAFQRSAARHLEPYNELRNAQQLSWCIIGAATPPWAARVFPGEAPDRALAKLWEALFTIVRADAADPLAAWRAHLASLARARDHLNAHRYAALRLRGPGTDLEIGLPRDHRWLDANFETARGVSYVANLPTEEVFTSPDRNRVEGTVRASRPLSYAGKMIEGLELRFAGGRVVEARAAKGQEVLEGVLDTDEGARRLGEIALVPHSSPISQSGLLFFDTLFDENAASHIALGRGFPFTLQGWQGRSAAEAANAGINHSLTHVDFMVGSEQLDVDGVTEDGRAEPLMRAGEWAFQTSAGA